MTRQEIETWMRYKAPAGPFTEKLDAMRLAATNLAVSIAENVPVSGCQIVALRKVKEALMAANAALVAPMPAPQRADAKK